MNGPVASPPTGRESAPLSPPRVLNAGEISSLPLDRAAAILPGDIIRDDEVILLLLRPSPLYIPLTSLGGLVMIGLVTFFLAYVARRFVGVVTWTDRQAFGLGVGLAALRLGWQTLEWWSRVYVLTDRRIIRRMGVLRVSVFEADLKNVQHSSVFRRVRERLFGLGSIGFATAGSDVFDVFWVMVGRPFAVHRIVVDAMRRYGRRRQN